MIHLDVKLFIDDLMGSILKRPQMYGQNVESMDAQIYVLLLVRAYAEHGDASSFRDEYVKAVIRATGAGNKSLTGRFSELPEEEKYQKVTAVLKDIIREQRAKDIPWEPELSPLQQWLEANQKIAIDSQGKWLAFHDAKGPLAIEDSLSDAMDRCSPEDEVIFHQFPLPEEEREKQ